VTTECRCEYHLDAERPTLAPPVQFWSIPAVRTEGAVSFRAVVDRKVGRPTLVDFAVPVIADPTDTEQIDAVMPSFGNTVTVTEFGADPLAPDAAAGGEHRATLVVVAGPAPGQVYTLREQTTLGRDPMADIQLEDSAVSRTHARIVIEDGNYFVEDLGSANGTIVRGTRIRRCQIESGDRIQLGPRVVLRFALLDEAEEIMHRQLFESSTRDALTGAYNKKYITERLIAEVAHALRHRSSLEVVVVDLDKFKHINDQYGHLVGDAVLRSVADRVHALIRSEDVFGRFGGEEFVLISRSSDAARLAERIRAAVESLAIPTDRGLLHATLSAGVARLDELGAQATARSLLDKADLRLLEAKRTGRNRVCSRD
jgi:two-component system, cell cycle response regulator